MERRSEPVNTIMGKLSADLILVWKFCKISPLAIDARSAMRISH